MSLSRIDLTTALRPALLPDEVLLFVQDAVGLYEGKFKIPDYQNGQAYLTSHRVCYVDNEEPRQRAVGIHLKDVDRSEFYAGFLKSSPKVILHPKISKRNSLAFRSAGNANLQDLASGTWSSSKSLAGSGLGSIDSPSRPLVAATWICPICSFSNPVPITFDPATANAHTPLPACQACGMKPPLIHMVKAALSSLQASNSSSPSMPRLGNGVQDFAASPETRSSARLADVDGSFVQCFRCTFENDPSMSSCEMCGALLKTTVGNALPQPAEVFMRSDSPGPMLPSVPVTASSTDSIKISFRAGGEKNFLDRLRAALIQRKWLLHSAPPVPRIEQGSSTPGRGTPDQIENQKFGIAGLEQRGLNVRKNNEVVIGNAFEDLEALMSSAKEIIELAERFASQTKMEGSDQTPENAAILSQSASALNVFTTKDMLNSGSGSETLYLSELSRNLAEFLTDDVTGVLKREGGIISLVDLWAVFNRARGGVELVSPMDFKQAAELWDKLRLPIRLRKFKSGLLFVQARDRTDEKTIANILKWLTDQKKRIAGTEGLPWNVALFGCKVTALETADHFGWSVGVATEELEMAEERGALCRDVGIEGVTFWQNWFLDSNLNSYMDRR